MTRVFFSTNLRTCCVHRSYRIDPTTEGSLLDREFPIATTCSGEMLKNSRCGSWLTRRRLECCFRLAKIGYSGQRNSSPKAVGTADEPRSPKIRCLTDDLVIPDLNVPGHRLVR